MLVLKQIRVRSVMQDAVCNLRPKKKELLIFMSVDYLTTLNIHQYAPVKNC